MKSAVKKRSIVIRGYKTSISMEDLFWEELKNIAEQRNMTLGNLVAEIGDPRTHVNLSSAIRIFVLEEYRKRVGTPQEATA